MFIVAAKRTAFGSFGGSFANTTATQLGVAATQAALADTTLDPSLIDACFFGSVLFSKDGAYLARHVALQSNCSIHTPALTINRLCGSGFETVIQACNAIQLNQASVAIAGGTENMSQAPLVLHGQDVRFQKGVPLGKGLHLEDALWDGLTDAHIQTPMGMTAENLAQQYSISRHECDAYAIRSQQLWAQAHAARVFRDEICPVEVPGKKRGTTVTVDTDEHPRPESTLEGIAKLKPVFSKEGVVTAANASGICDGAGTILVASEEACQQHNLQPLCRIVSHAVTGCDPSIMGIGPVKAIQQALQKAGDWDLERDIDRVEINEAFAAQTLACAKELQLNMDKTNIHGGAISLGHPLGASGSRIMATLAHSFQQTPEQQKVVGSACIGGGQGIAVVLERV